MTIVQITIAGEAVELLPQRALYLPARDTLLVADLHWGKAAAFRAAHVPIPTGTTAADLARLTEALQQTGAQQLIVLGDLLHARAGRQPGTLDTITAWREQHRHIAMRLVRGNHDTHAGDPPPSLDIECVDAPFVTGPFACIHDPAKQSDGYALAGHLHPNVALRGRGHGRLRFPCFVIGTSVGILPAFSSFTGSGAYEPTAGDALYAIVEDQVLPVRV